MEEHENSKDIFNVVQRCIEILHFLHLKMDADECKNYLSGILFYKYLSDSFLIRAYDLLFDEKPEDMNEAMDAYCKALEDDDTAEALKEELKRKYRYIIEPDLTYTSIAEAARNGAFNRECLQMAFNNIEQSDPIFTDIFNYVNLYSNLLGNEDQRQTHAIASLIKEIDNIDLLNYDDKLIGDSYEYLIHIFASGTGKMTGEFYTPQAVSEIMTRIAISGQAEKKELSVYDACMGSGSLLLKANRFSLDSMNIRFYGQELNMSTYNLARMNMFFHGVDPWNQHLRNGDALGEDWPNGEETEFDMVLMDPPYSARWYAVEINLEDERFRKYGVLASKSRADYAFLLHGLYHLKSSGTMAIVLPQGVLFRGGAEERIREKLLRSGNIYAVIGLPDNLLYYTSIQTCIIVLKKHRGDRNVLFIDASKKFDRIGKQNVMMDEHINEVLALYTRRETIENESCLATFENIENNNFNLKITEYTDVLEG